MNAMTKLIVSVQPMFNRFENRQKDGAVFAAVWIPVAIFLAGAAAMTVYCNSRGYAGWEWKWTWRGLKASCYR